MSMTESLDSTAVLFSGQGREVNPGIGLEAYTRYAASKLVFMEASEAMGIDMARACFGDRTFLLKDARIAQPAMITDALAQYAALVERHGTPRLVTGMSLGYLGAMGATGVFETYGDTIGAVAERAVILHGIHERNPAGGMAGLVGLAQHELEPILKRTGARLAVTRDLIRKSFVIAGSNAQIESTEAEAKKSGVRKFERLGMSGIFHHDDNAEGQPLFMDYLLGLSLNDPKVRLLGNHALLLETAGEAAQHAVDQLVDSVEWDATIEVLPKEGITKVVEVGSDDSRGLARQVAKRFQMETMRFPEVA